MVTPKTPLLVGNLDHMTEFYDNPNGHGMRPLFGPKLNNAQHGGLIARYSLHNPNDRGFHTIDVMDKDYNDVGHLRWSNLGPINYVGVIPEYRRRGVATAMYQLGHQLAREYSDRVNSGPEHSRDRTPEGDAWAKAVGGWLPPIITKDESDSWPR
jgi:GNAT superfamily N-acetyltransferase